MTSGATHGLMLCDDLIFFSRVELAARAAHLTVRRGRTVAEFLDLARSTAPGGVILDLQHPGLDLPELMKSLNAIASPVSVVAYGSHVDVESLRAARAAECRKVMPRSQFVEELNEHIAEWLTPAPAG